jgi:hypothetical protein
METLLLAMPSSKNSATALHQPISSIFATGRGPDYALTANDRTRIVRGMRVIVFDRNSPPQQAEGTVDQIVPSGNVTKNRRRRYHVLIHNLKETAYSHPPAVKRINGVGFM